MKARLTLLTLAAVAGSLALPVGTASAVTCPNANPVVNENNCQGAGSTGWRLTNYNENGVFGFATKTSVNRGEDVMLKIRRGGSAATASLSVYRIGYYGGAGGRLVHSAPNVAVGGGLACNPTNAITGLADCNNWGDSYTIPAATLPAAGVYVVRLVDNLTGNDSQIVFTVRDDNRNPEAKVLYTLPVSTYQAYNGFTGKALYDAHSTGANTIAASPRAVKVSFDRPYRNQFRNDNWFMKSDFALIFWLERQGYDVAYTDNVANHQNPAELSQHDALVISGHDEYWSGAELAAYKSARDAGVDIASFSGNTAYWKVRYEDGGDTLVCYKTVQGASGDGSVGVNDPGPDGVAGTADDAVGTDGVAGTADDHPEHSTTTFRDNGAPPGDANAPPGGRVGPDTPENALLGAMYAGDDDNYSGLRVPGPNGSGDFSADRIWRRAGLPASGAATTIGLNFLGWEWDSIPGQAQYLSRQPAGVKRLTETNPSQGPSVQPEWIQDEGRLYGPAPPPGASDTVSSVKYTAPSGARVFHAGTNNWSWGLGPHWINVPGFQTYLDPPVDSNDGRIRQATYNILADAGVRPDTPDGISIDSNEQPVASFSASPDPAQAGQNVTFNAGASSDPDGSIAKYEWDLDGNGSYETDTGTTATTSRSYANSGALSVKLRVTDNGGATGRQIRTITIGTAGSGPYSAAVRGTNGLKHYWRMGETAGDTFVDSKGGANATLTGATLGGAGAIANDGDAAGNFDGADDSTAAGVDLSGSNRLTVEFWLRWNAFANDDDLALELTSNFNKVGGGLLVDPNAPEVGGRFAVAIGRGLSRNNAYFARPSAGQWHHYALVLDTTAPAASQVTPYVDGQPVAYTKTESGTGAGNFANSTLYFMSRNADSLFGAGGLDEVAIYDGTLSSGTIADHYAIGRNQAPTASFTVTPNPVAVGGTVNFNAGASNDVDGSIAKYEWDLDGNGSYETDTGTTATASRAYTSGGSVTVGLRVTDNRGESGTTTRTLSVGSQAPTAAFTVSPNPAQVGDNVNFNAAASNDPDGSIVRYEWDLDGNGSYETDTGATASASKAYTAAGTIATGLRVTDSSGATGTTTRSLAIQNAGGNSYPESVLGTPALVSYWRMGDLSGTHLADSKGQNHATLSGPALGAPGALAGDSNTAASFDGTNDFASAGLNLSGAGKLTLEFWLKWNAFSGNDDLALEFTPNFNQNDGGVLVDPNAPEVGGRFAVAIGRGLSRNNAYFARPSANQWHHYALVLDTTAPAASQVTPYVDGQPVAYTKTASGTGAGNFADSALYFMSRGGGNLFGAGTLDELAIYDTALSGATIAEHFETNNAPPSASFTVSPNPAQTGQNVSFAAGASSDPDGSIAKYEWDLDGNGSYETDTGTTATTSRSYANAGSVTVGLRVTDNDGGTDATTRSLSIQAQNDPPTAAFTISSNPALTGQALTFNGSGSSDPDGPIAGYEWDLDGDGSFETDTGTSATVTRTYASPAKLAIKLRVTDGNGTTDTKTNDLTIDGDPLGYRDSVLATPAVKHYWRLGDTGGNIFTDAKGGADATRMGATLGAGGALTASGDSNPAAAFDGSNDFAVANVNLSATSKTTVEFWLKWDAFANNDDLALELTPNFNVGDGGILIDPNAPEVGGRFAAAIGRGSSRNNAYFPRPSAGQWHHYAFVFDSSAGAADQVKPYVDGQPASYSKTASGTGAGTFASAQLFFMSRGGGNLFGAGTLDDLAVYGGALAPGTVLDHYRRGITRPPDASFTATPNPATQGVPVNFNASASSDPDGTIAKYEWDLDGNGSYETDTGTSASASRSYSSAGTVQVRLRVTDNAGAVDEAYKVLTVN